MKLDIEFGITETARPTLGGIMLLLSFPFALGSIIASLGFMNVIWPFEVTILSINLFSFSLFLTFFCEAKVIGKRVLESNEDVNTK